MSQFFKGIKTLLSVCSLGTWSRPCASPSWALGDTAHHRSSVCIPHTPANFLQLQQQQQQQQSSIRAVFIQGTMSLVFTVSMNQFTLLLWSNTVYWCVCVTIVSVTHWKISQTLMEGQTNTPPGTSCAGAAPLICPCEFQELVLHIRQTHCNVPWVITHHTGSIVEISELHSDCIS